jgi:hypothetical protein
MIVSDARISANRLNGRLGEGPLTPETRAISARNGLKHGLTGKGIVVSADDREEIGRRIEALTGDMKPISQAGVFLIAQMATLSLRSEHAAEHESAAIAKNVRHAADDFDEHRIDQANALFEILKEDPRNNLRKLRKSPEGVARMVDEWHDLKADLNIDPEPEWTASHLERAGYLLGLKSQHARGSRIGALSRAYRGDFSALGKLDGAGLGDDARRAWARAALLEAIDAEIAALEEHYVTLDFDAIDLDRAEAGSRALFDSSKTATLARRYEAEARRGFFKALKEFRLVEAEAAAKVEAAPTLPTGTRSANPDRRMGSSRENHQPARPEPARPVANTDYPEYPAAVDRDGKRLVFATPAKPPG